MAPLQMACVLACRLPPACLSRLQRPTTAKQPGQGSLLIQIPQSMPLAPSGWPLVALLLSRWNLDILFLLLPSADGSCPRGHQRLLATIVMRQETQRAGVFSRTSAQDASWPFRSFIFTKPCDKTQEVRRLHCGPPEDLSAMCISTDRSHSGPIDQRHDHRERTTHPPIRFRPDLVASGRRLLFVADELQSPHHREPDHLV